MTGSHYEISPREREDEQRRHRDEFDLEYEDFFTDYLARLSELPEAGNAAGAAHQPGTGSSESCDKEAA